MKNLLIILCVFFTFQFAHAQTDVSEAKRSMSSGMLNSFLIELPDVSAKAAEENWKKFTKPYGGKIKYNRKTKEWVTTGAKIPSLSSTTVTVYAKLLEDRNDPDVQTNVIVWFDTGNGFADTEENEELGSSARAIMVDYAMATSKHHAETVLKGEQEKLDVLQKKLKGLQKDKKDYQKKMSDAEKTVADMKKKIEVNELDQSNMEKIIEEQKEAVEVAEANVGKFRG